ncbi:MAG: hypothetical protein WA631_02825 [Nitrososphaeraceae archaeon]
MKEEHKLVALGIALLLLSSVLVTGLGMTTWVEAKKKSSDSGSGSSDSGSSSGGSSDSSSSDSSGGSDKGSSDSGSTGNTDSGDKGPSGPSKEDTKDLASDTPQTDAAIKGSPHTGTSKDTDKTLPFFPVEKGGRVIQGGQPPVKFGKIHEPGLTPPNLEKIHKPVAISITKIIIEIHGRIHHSSSGGGHHTHTPAGVYWSNEDMTTLNMIWANGINKGQDPEVDAFMTRMIG